MKYAVDPSQVNQTARAIDQRICRFDRKERDRPRIAGAGQHRDATARRVGELCERPKENSMVACCVQADQRQRYASHNAPPTTPPPPPDGQGGFVA